MESESRRARQRRELVEEIVGAARRRLAADGPQGVTLRGIARDVGLSAPSLYTYFPSLADLFTEMIVRSNVSLADAIAASLRDAEDADLGARLAAGPEAYHSWAIEHRGEFNLIFFDQIAAYAAPEGGPTVDAQTKVLLPIAAVYAEALHRTSDDMWNDEGLLDDFLAWWGAFHGIVALEVNHHLDWRDPSAIFARHMESSVAAVLSQASG